MKRALGAPLKLANGSVVPLSQAVQCGDFVYVSGQVAFDGNGVISGGVADQTRRILTNIKALVQEAGGTLADVVKCNCWLTDTKDFPEFNRVYAEFFPAAGAPARSTVRADLMVDALVEIDAIAYLPRK